MQLQFRRRLSRGLQALASYTGSHAIELTSGETYLQAPAARIDPRIDRGSADFDVRHSFSAAATYDIPAPFANRAARAFLGDWAVDAIFRARTATPVEVFINFALFREFGLTRPDLVPGIPLYLDDPRVAGGRRINRAAFSTPPPDRQGSLGRNALRGFPVSQLDFALRRKFNLTERLNLQFRADVFNLFNHPNFGDPNSFIRDPNFGQSLQMLGRSLGSGGSNAGFNPLYQIGGPRSIQLALKLLF